MIVESGNDYIGALKGNQPKLLAAVTHHFQTQPIPSQQQTVQHINKGHGRIEKRRVSVSYQLEGIPDFPGLQTLIQVQSERQVHRSTII